MMDPQPTKTHREENFPVASLLIHPRHRRTILAFYRFARAADDVADDPALSERDKLARLDRLEQSLLGAGDPVPDALPLREALAARSLSARHAQDLLVAFRMDVVKHRYQNWEELIQYCSYSAMPVGRFVLDVHGQRRATWPASDALCTALQIINHLQDCGQDYRLLDRVYIPLDAMASCGMTAEMLGAGVATPSMRRCLRDLVERTAQLLRQAAPLSPLVDDLRLGLEIAVIDRLARVLIRLLARRDPLRQRVHLNAAGVAGWSLLGAAEGFARRVARHVVNVGRKAQDA